MFKANPLQHIHVTSPYGYRTHPVTGQKQSFHSGIDLRANIGTPIYAVDDGRVVVSKCNGGGPSVGYGYYMVVQHKDYCTLYAHLKELGLPAGANVKAGDRIGFTGATGRVSGPHLHFEVRDTLYNANFWNRPGGQAYKAIDPAQFFSSGWETILRKSVDMPDEWIDWIKEQDKGIARFLPQLIEKVYAAGKSS